jgi:hydrogenase maturation protease
VSPGQNNAVLVIGVGNPYRHDDGVGPLVVRKLRAQPSADTIFREESGEGSSLMAAWQDASAVIMVDAVQSGGKPGTIYRLNAGRKRLPSRFFHFSTHAFSVAEAVELARALKRLPPLLIIYGVEGRDFESGEGLSPEVAMAVEAVLPKIRRELVLLRRRLVMPGVIHFSSRP